MFAPRAGSAVFAAVLVLVGTVNAYAQNCGDGHVDTPAEECDEPVGLGRCVDCRRIPCAGHTVCDVLPAADTYIAAGTDKAFNNGVADQLFADSDKRTITYLKFDLRDIRPPVVEARLTLVCRNPTESVPPDFGTVYPVRDSSWVEGDRDGAPNVPPVPQSGLRWIDVDSDDDGAIDSTERSRYAPVVTAPVATLGPCVPGATSQALITSAFQDGPGIYTIALTTNDRDAISWASREHARIDWRPVLHVRVSSFCGDGNVDPGETCDDGDTEDGDGCDSNCLSGCGNGIATAGEECDDGNALDDDCCTKTCTRNLSSAGCACGNGQVGEGEDCDAGVGGQRRDSTGCDADCTFVRCGDGYRNMIAGEGCDDANLVDGDGCRSSCQRDCCARQNVAGCDDASCRECVGQIDRFCIETLWDERCVAVASSNCAGACLCGGCQDAFEQQCGIKPSADTYIEGPNPEGQTPPFCDVNDCPSCGQVTWDHGGRDRVDVDGKPYGFAYFKFDLRGFEHPIVKATLKLYNTNPSVNDPDDGPGDGGAVYKLGDSSWVEGVCDGLDATCGCIPEVRGPGDCPCDSDGTCRDRCDACPSNPRNDSACHFGEDMVECSTLERRCSDRPVFADRPPLTFYQVDLNHNGLPDDESSPYLPHPTRDMIVDLGPVELGEVPIDVSAAFRDAAIYSLVIGQVDELNTNGSTYTSREYLDPTRQPKLEVELGCLTDAECKPKEQSCMPFRCRDGICLPGDIDPTCVPCPCNDHNPCTTDRCLGTAEGCESKPILPGLGRATCALEKLEPSDCSSKADRKFSRRTNRTSAKQCQRLAAACAGDSSRLRMKLKRATGRLRAAKESGFVAGVRGRITPKCAQSFIDRLSTAVANLEQLGPDTLCADAGSVTCPEITMSSRGHRKERSPIAARRR